MTDVGKEYAEALFALASEERGSDYRAALSVLKALIHENPDYIELLASPGIPMRERQTAVDEVFHGDEVLDNIASFIKLLCERGHVRELPGMIEGFEELYKAATGVSTAYVTTAVEMTGEERGSMKKRLEEKLGRRVELVCEVDPSLIGGAIVRVDGRIMDGSVRHRLQSIKDIIG